MSTQRRAGAGGITPAPATPDQQHRARLTVAAAATGPDDCRRLLDALGLLHDPTTHNAAPTPTRRPSPGGAAEPLPDVLTPRQAATIARRLHRHHQPIPERISRLLAHERARRTA